MLSVGKFIRYIEPSKIFLVHHFLSVKNTLPSDFPFFIEMYPNQYVPYFVEYATQRDIDILELKIQESLSMQVGKEFFLQKEIFLEEKEFLQCAGFYSPLRYLDFDVFDKKNEFLGIFKNIFEHQGKWCMRICSSQNEEMFVYLSNKKIQELFDINTIQKKLILL